MAFPPLAELLPHGPPMLWLDEVLRFDGNAREADCSLRLRPDQPFLEGETVSLLFALEWLAQTAYVLRVLCARERGVFAPSYVLGPVAEAHFEKAVLALGDTLVVSAREHPDGSFSGQVTRAGQCICSAQFCLHERALASLAP